jgi:hypothetical protein
MSKVLKIAAAVTAIVALTIATGGAAAFGIAGALSTTVAGISAATLLTVSSALSIGASLLAKKPKAPSINSAAIDRLNSTIDPRTPRKMVLGDTAGGNDVRDQEYTDDQTYLHRFIVVASHKVHAIYEIWFDDKKAWDSTSGVTSDFTGYLTVAPILEGNAGNAINISARMGTTRRYTGLAYVHLRFKLTGNSKKTESPFAQSVPTRVTIRTKGALVYDPRLDSTVPGGSGSHRANDQTTWAWNDDAARNPALQLLWWMLGWKINGKLAVGGGIPPARIDLESFITAANLCDEDVTLAVGGTEPRYRSDGVMTEGDSPTLIVDALKAAMNADLDDVGGKLRLFVFHNDLATPAADFTDDDILGAFEYRASPALDETFNVVRGTYTDPRDVSLYQQIDYPQVELTARDGIDRIDTFPLVLVQSASQAQRLAKQRLQRQQYGGIFTATGQATWWKVQKNSVVRLTFAPRGWTNKLFRVVELEHRVDGTVPITLREESAQIYAWDAEEAPPVEPVDPSEYDFAKNPINQDIDSALVVVVPPPAQTVFADFLGAPLAGQYPRTLKPLVTRGTVDIRTSDAVTYAITPSDGISAAIDNTTGSASKGWITVTDGGSGAIALTVTVSGTNFGPYSIVFNRVTFDPPSAGGPGSKMASDNSFPTVNSGTDGVVAGPMTVTVATGEALACSFPAEYNITDTTNASAKLRGKWQTSPAGAGTWTDVGSYITGSAASWIASDFSGDPGSGNFNQTASGLSAGDYDVRFLGALVDISGTPDLTIFEGTARVIVS